MDALAQQTVWLANAPQPTAELEVDHIECVECGTRLAGVYVRVRDGLCRKCQREAKAGNR